MLQVVLARVMPALAQTIDFLALDRLGAFSCISG